MSWHGLDLYVLHALNGLCGKNWALDHFLALLTLNNFVKTAPFLASFWALWISRWERSRRYVVAGLWRDKLISFEQPGQGERREKLLLMLFAVMIALIANRALSMMTPFRPRPVFTPGIDLHAPLLENSVVSGLDHWSSFPSDHAAFLFAMAAGLWFVSRPVGVMLSLWSVGMLAPRIYFGIHYPSDLAVGALLGIAAACVANLGLFHRLMASPLVGLEGRTPGYFNALLFIIALEMGNLFEGVRQIGKGVFRVLRHYVSFGPFNM